jgi:hypothetical protein
VFYLAALESESWFSICVMLNESASSSDDIVTVDWMTVFNGLEWLLNDGVYAKG